MVSRKGSANKKRVEAFKSQLGGMDDLFAREERRTEESIAHKDAAYRKKACSSKNRYFSRAEAEATAAECAAHGAPKLHVYRCPFCDGWHLTSKPPRK